MYIQVYIWIYMYIHIYMRIFMYIYMLAYALSYAFACASFYVCVKFHGFKAVCENKTIPVLILMTAAFSSMIHWSSILYFVWMFINGFCVLYIYFHIMIVVLKVCRRIQFIIVCNCLGNLNFIAVFSRFILPALFKNYKYHSFDFTMSFHVVLHGSSCIV